MVKLDVDLVILILVGNHELTVDVFIYFLFNSLFFGFWLKKVVWYLFFLFCFWYTMKRCFFCLSFLVICFLFVFCFFYFWEILDVVGLLLLDLLGYFGGGLIKLILLLLVLDIMVNFIVIVNDNNNKLLVMDIMVINCLNFDMLWVIFCDI